MNIPPKIARKKVRELVVKNRYKLRSYRWGSCADNIMKIGMGLIVLLIILLPFI